MNASINGFCWLVFVGVPVFAAALSFDLGAMPLLRGMFFAGAGFAGGFALGEAARRVPTFLRG